MYGIIFVMISQEKVGENSKLKILVQRICATTFLVMKKASSCWVKIEVIDFKIKFFF